MPDDIDREMTQLVHQRTLNLLKLQHMNSRATLHIETAMEALNTDKSDLYGPEVTEVCAAILENVPDDDSGNGKNPVIALEFALLAALRMARGVQKSVDISFGKAEPEENGGINI